MALVPCIVVEVTNAVAPLGAEEAPIYTSDGFPGWTVKELYTFDDANPSVSAASSVGGFTTAPGLGIGTAPVPAKTNAAGGGVILTNTANIPLAEPIDVAEPFTFLWSGIVAVPLQAATPHASAVLSTKEWTGNSGAWRGFQLRATSNAAITTATLIGFFTATTTNGVKSGEVSTAAINGGTYDDFLTFVVQHDGEGNFTFRALKAGDLVLNATFAWDVGDMVDGGTGNASTLLTPMVGVDVQTNAADGTLTVDAMGVYTSKLSLERLVEFDAKARELATERGRAL